MSNQLLGRATVKVAGQTLRTKPGARFNPGGTARSTVVGARPGDVGYTEATRQSSINFELMVDSSLDIDAIENWRDVTVLFEADTGQQWVMDKAYRTETLEITSGDNSGATIVLEGPPARKV